MFIQLPRSGRYSEWQRPSVLLIVAFPDSLLLTNSRISVVVVVHYYLSAINLSPV